MKLSVIIPVYNGADFIQKSYQSIINQNLMDFEIIYVDNNSEDDSLEKVKLLKHTDPRVTLKIQEKQGAAPARNLGIKNAKGEYIYIFDVDDEIYPNALNTMIKVLDNDLNIDAVFGKMVKSNKGIADTVKPLDESFKVVLKDKPYWGLKWFSNLKIVVGPPAFLYRKRIFDRIGMYNEAIRNNEDTALDIKLGMTSTVAFLDMYVYLYFKHEASTIQTSKRQMQRAFMIWPRLIKEHLPFYLENDVPLQFKQMLFSQIYQSIGRQLQFTKGLKNRIKLKRQLLSEIKVVPLPFNIIFFLPILVLFPFKFVRKFYGFYVVRPIVKRINA